MDTQKVLAVDGKTIFEYMKKTGRPTEYKPEYCQQLVTYFTEQVAASKLPFLSKWAREEAGVCEQTALRWVEAHEEFSEAYKKAKDMQKECLIENALTGKFQQTFAIFTAKNITDMRDVQETKNQTDFNITGLEKLTDEQLDAVIKKFQNPTGKSTLRESEEGGAESAPVRPAA
jgi:hypothetical protein